MLRPKAFIPTRNYSKYNFVEAVENLIPDIYLVEDFNLSGVQINPLDQIINSHIVAVNHISDILYVSSPGATSRFANIDNVSGFSQFLVKQNNFTEITPDDFERDILIPIGNSFRQFETSALFQTFVNETLLPQIRVNAPTFAFVGTASGNHEYLIDSINWLYFLNTSATGYDPSAIVSNLIVDKLYFGQPIYINDAVKAFQEYLWRNYGSYPDWAVWGVIPSLFLSGSGTWTSGTQQLEKLKTLIDVIYSPLYIDSQDTRVRDAFSDFFSLTSYLSGEDNKGPFHRLIKAFSYLFRDVDEQIETLDILYDIEQCPDKWLPCIADLIGWPLFGFDPSRWRLQLYNAVDIFKRIGTKRGLKLAVDSLFGESVFEVSSYISELWESYVPNLIYYSLATESSSLNSFSSWTKSLALSLGVSSYSVSNMDDNIRYCVDTIIYELVKKFPDAFKLGNSSFPVGDENFIFNYRNRDYPIPPFEEWPYYIRTEITESMVVELEDLLACFGVRQEFALQVGDYLRDNILRAYDVYRENNNWLIFVSSMQIPPNWSNLLDDVGNKRTEFLSLWCGKSSHFLVSLEAGSFNFSSVSLTSDSRYAVLDTAQIINKFSPAHSIPLINVGLSSADVLLLTDASNIYLGVDKSENFTSVASSVAFNNSEISAVAMNGWNRSTQTGNPFARKDVDSITDSLINSTSAISAYRNSFRRRNYRNVINLTNFYSRSGWNGPIAWGPSSTYNGFLPLGYVPSACQFIPIPINPKFLSSIDDYAFLLTEIPDIYSQCLTRNSSELFSGVYVSSTYPCRGIWAITPTDLYVDRGQPGKIFWVMTQLADEVAKAKVQAHLNYTKMYDTSTYNLRYAKELSWRDVIAKYANYNIASGVEFTSSMDKFFDFSFGKNLPKLYQYYNDEFGRHYLAPVSKNLFGCLVFAHVYGSILRNSEFDEYGQAYSTTPSLVTSSVSATTFLRPGENIFAYSGIASYGSELKEDSSSLVIFRLDSDTEIRNNNLLSGVTLIQTSGTSPLNNFVIYNLQNIYENKTVGNNYLINNPIVKLKAVDGVPRIRFDLNHDYVSSLPYVSSTNLLIPEHEFELTVNAIGGFEDGKTLGGVKLGVWVHTDWENGFVWSYTPRGWEVHRTEAITKDKLINELLNIYEFGISSIPQSPTKKKYRCINLTTNKSSDNPYLPGMFEKEDYFSVKFNFDTKNNFCIPDDYYKLYGQVNRRTQNYVIEIMMVPSQVNMQRFILIDDVNLVDKTLNGLASIPVSSAYYRRKCEELSVPVSKDQLYEIFRFWKGLILASRNATDTSGSLGVSGGSRLNYRIAPEWVLNASGNDFIPYGTLEFEN